MGALHLKTKKQITPDNQTAVSGKSPEKKQPERDWPSLLAIVGLALAFRLIYFWQLTCSPVYQYRIHDSAVFHELAHSILKNGLILAQPFYLAPLYTYFLAAIYFLFGDALNVVRVIQFTLGVGTAWLVFRIARHFFDRQTGLVAGLLAAVYAPFLFFEGNLLGTAVETFLLTASVGCLIETQKERRAPGMAAGYPSRGTSLRLHMVRPGRNSLTVASSRFPPMAVPPLRYYFPASPALAVNDLRRR